MIRHPKLKTYFWRHTHRFTPKIKCLGGVAVAEPDGLFLPKAERPYV